MCRGLRVDEHANALYRNNENTAIVAWVCRALHARTSAYRYALERLVIAAPSPAAADTQRAITLLQMRIAQYCPPPPGPPGRIVRKS